MMTKKVMKVTVMKKNLVSLFTYYNKKYLLFFFSKNIDEDDLSEDEVSANPVEGRYTIFLQKLIRNLFFRSTKR
jgi:hypothetical protein